MIYIHIYIYSIIYLYSKVDIERVSRSSRTVTMEPCIKFTFFRNTKLFSSGRGSFLMLSAEGHAGGPPVHHGASVGPGRAPWRVL